MNRHYIDKEILRLSLPAIVSNITVPLLSLSDTTISGHLGSVGYLAAIASGSMMFNTVFWLFGFLRMGTTGLTAQAYGAENKSRVRTIFSQAFILSVLIGIFLIAIHTPLREILLYILNPDKETGEYASSYFNITIMSAPALLGTMAVTGWFFGMQSTLIPMIISISVNIINIGLSLWFVFGLDTGFNGVAWGTFYANWCGLVIALMAAIVFKGKEWLMSTWKEISRWKELRRFFSVNSDIFFRSACIMAVSMSVTAFGSHIGSLTLATNTVMMQFFIFFSYFMDGLAFTAEAMCGRFSGRNNLDALKLSVRRVLFWGIVVMLLFLILYSAFNEEITGFITNNPEVRFNIRKYSGWLISIPPVTVCAFIFDGIFIGLTATRRMLIATFAAAIIFFSVCIVNVHDGHIFLQFPTNNNLLWAAFLSYLAARGLILALMSHRVISKGLQYS